MYHLRKLKSLLLLLLVAVTAKAQIESGNVYNFVNVDKNTQSLAISGVKGVSITGTDTQDYTQLWYVERNSAGGYTLRNLGSGRYLRSSNETSRQWTMVKEIDDNCKFNCPSVSGNYTLLATNTSGWNYMHYGESQGCVVGWESGANASQWKITKVDISDEELEANWSKLASIDPSADVVTRYQQHLVTLFSDQACTTLNSPYASMDETTLKNQAAYKALPATLQQMVLKVRNDNWAEANYDDNKPEWGGDYAKKYRVQWYEPYNEPGAAASALGINAHSNLNNPTGIFANNAEALYVMVEGEIKTGASLYLASYTGHGKPGGYDDGYELKVGLNVIPSAFVGNNYCINYVVHTFDTEGDTKKGNEAKAYQLSDFPDLKIHIEGGYINGYWNKMGDALYTPDTDTDWNYIEARATQTTVTVLGEYITLQFPLLDKDAVEENGKQQKGLASYYNDQVSITASLNEWDKMMMWERLVLGLLDKNTTTNTERNPASPYSSQPNVIAHIGDETDGGYGDYYNVHGLAYGIPNRYMFAGWDYCGYNYNTMQDIIVNITENAGVHWGPAHEMGHQHQSLILMRGETEASNNLFANAVLWYFGETTSRVNGTEGSLENVLKNFNTETGHYLTNSIWGMTQMYYKLFLYYHVLGHNPKFYPRLFEMLRQDPMEGMSETVDGAKAQLHLYKKVCQAAEEDLTEFFRAYGFFKPLSGFEIDDYGKSTFNMTQAQIDAAIKEVEALGYDENIAVLFVNDATGETIQSHKGGALTLYGETTVCAEVGGYASFTANTTPDYTYSVSGTTVTMEGTGGVGFAIFNEDGELLAFSDKKTFEVSSECAAAIASGKAEVKTVKADNTIVGAVDIMDSDNVEAKYKALGELLEAVGKLTALVDKNETKVGYYRPASLTSLTAAYNEAKTAYDNQTANSYAAVYEVLLQAYTEVQNDEFARIGIIETNAYQLANKAYNGYSITDNGTSIYGTTASSDAQKWYFDSADSEGHYYIRNKSTGNYLTHAGWGSVVNVTQEIDNAQKYTLQDLGNGLWALTGGYSLHCSKSQSYGVVGWDANADASQWYITAVEVDENAEALHELQTLIEKTEALVDEMATVQYKGGAIDMNACIITSNATETGHETKYLTDGNPNTFFHTVWSGSVVNDYHNIVIDLGEGHSLAEFALNYTTLPTTSNNVDAPESLTVQGSNDGSSYTDIASLSALYGLPTTKGAEYTSSTLGTSSQAYRYIRLQVKTATGGKLSDYYYFGLAEMALLRMTTLVDAIGDKYQNFITPDALKAACDQVYAAQQTIASGSATSDDVEALQTQYDILLEAHQKANNVEFNAKRDELLALINSTNSLINTCGTITYTPATLDGALALQTTNPNGSWYVSTNADHNHTYNGAIYKDGDGIAALVDNNEGTYFHTRWGGAVVNEPHYIQVDMGNGVTINDFVFSYKPRNDSPAPTSMIVYGSDVPNSFTDKLATITSGLPNHNSGSTYNSATIVSDKAYRYLRFTVTGSQGPGNNKYNNQYFFGMLEFDLTAVGRPESYTAELGAQAGEATSDLLLATYHAVNEAQDVYDQATTERQVNDAIAALQVKYDALYSAMYPDVEYTISSNAANGGVIYKGNDYTTTLSAPTTLTVGELTAIDLENEGYVAKSVTLNGRTITVTYNKVYNVQVVGVDAATGGVKLGETTYYGGVTFDMLESSFDINNFTAIPVEGYAPYKTFDGTTITVTYKKVYAVNVVGVAGQGGVVFESNDYTHGQELHALNLEIGNLTAMPLTGYVANVALEGTTITVTYNKIYTVQVVGLDGQGGVQFSDGSYTHGQELNALNLQVGSLIAIVPEGYVANVALEGTTITVTYKKVYTVNVVGINGQGGVLFGGDEYEHEQEIHVQGTLDENQLEALSVDGYAAYISVVDATIHVTYKMIYRVEVVGGDGNGAVTFEGNTYANNTEVHALSTIEINQLTAVDGSDYVGTITLDGRTIRVTYCKLVKDLSDLRNYKAYHIRAKSGEGYLAYNSSITEGYVSLRGVTNSSNQGLPSDVTVANKYTEAVSLSDKTVAWQIIKEDENYYLYQPEKGAYVTRSGRDYKFIAEKTALDDIRQNSGEYAGTFGIHAGGGYSDGSTSFACICTGESEIAVRNWAWDDHGAVLQIIENPYVYNLDYVVEVIGGEGNGGVEFEGETYTNNSPLSATELLTASDLTALPMGSGYEGVIAIDRENGTITVTYMKKYTVCLYGEEGTGVIFYDNQQYQNGDVILVSGNIDERLIGVLGSPYYDYDRAVVDHTLGTITINYTLIKSDMADYQATTTQLINDAAGVLDEAEIASFEARIDEIRTQCEDASLYNDYRTALNDWTTANEEFAAAIETAKTAAVEAARNELRALIAKTTALIERCGTVEYTKEKKVRLQTDSVNAAGWLSTNADQNVVGDGTDGDGIAALLDGSINTYMHTQWGGTPVDDDHYVQVNLGEGQGLAEFSFTYATRYKADPNFNSPAPSVIEVYGSVDGKNFTDSLATFSSDDPDNALPLYTEAGEYWTSATITSNTNYEYIRFYVRDSRGPGASTLYGGHHFFAMSEFALTSIGEEGWNVNLNANVGCVTKDQLLEIYQANIDAATLADNSAVKEDLVAEKNSLQALYEALLEATLPVVLTTDANAPVLYVIKTKRDNNPVLQYDESSGMFSVTTAVAGQATQAFYFMKGDKVEGTQQVYIYPYMAGGKVLAANDVDDGHSKALAMDKSTATYEQWVFVEQADGYYNLQPAGKSTYLSNYGGTGNKMGFYSSNPTGDPGSLLMFESTTVEGSYYYLKLKNYYETEVKVTDEIQGDNTAVGYYPVDQATAYNTAYAATTAALANTETTEVEYQTAYTDLVAANKALVMNMPVVGKYYVIRSANANNAYTGKLMSATEENAIWWNKGKTKEDPEALWTFTSDGYLESLHTGCAVNTTSGEAGLGDAPKVISIKSISGDGQVLLTPEGGYPLHADQFGHVVGWGTYDAGSASAWRIEEVGHVAKIGTYNYTSLYLNYPTTIPADVEAYIAKNVKKETDEEYATIDLVKLNGNVLPAQTGVILYSATPGDYNFLYTANEATDNVGENLLEGSDRVQYIGDETGTYKYYIFGRSGGEVGLYWAKMDYNADGTSAGGTDRGNYFKASANKVYLKLEVQPGTALSGFRFRIGNEVTGLEDVTIGADTVIYDLYGRRILEVVTPGLYIINGEKRYINIK